MSSQPALFNVKDISFVKTSQGEWQAIYDRYPSAQKILDDGDLDFNRMLAGMGLTIGLQ